VAAGIVSRTDDALPGRDELLSSPARHRGLPRPVLSVLLGHTKNWAFRELLKTPAVDGEAARPFLDAYFPARLRARHAGSFEQHPLRREIIATAVVNHLVNHAGMGFLHRVMAATGADIGRVATAYLDVDRQTGAQELRAALLAAGHPVEKELQALLQIEAAIEAEMLAMLGNGKGDPGRALRALKGTLGV